MKVQSASRNLYKWLGVISMTVFVVGVGLVVNYMISFQMDVANRLSLSSAAHINAVKPIATQISLILSVPLLAALCTLLFTVLYFNEVSKQREIIYVETIKEEDTDSSKKEAEEQKEEQSLAEILQERKNNLMQHLANAPQKTGLGELEALMMVLCEEIQAVQGALFVVRADQTLHMVSSYAYFSTEKRKVSYGWGEGLTGQVAKDAQLINIKAIPEGYVTVLSGLGKSSPKSMIIAPIKDENGHVIAVVEVASFAIFDATEEQLIEAAAPMLASTIGNNYEKIVEEL
ncbi:GAF domain-containing protein [Flexibacter flexilis DSM 6793]|uniref:GAF domain-containing protein n=1 Tax=Flexibacter flexilis DSM 6793 TaxID=927664 RepID=A0A1I1N2Q0_9BACT|nr:GAF domain-containing protein [Flexibacter flexilis]SFC91921.1 GAF domain-containing protein [Flexibacter flexilis DSM 6793]